MIVTDFLTSPVPVIIYISLKYRSASPGVFVTLAANVAAMAPGTNIRSSPPCEPARRHGFNDDGKGHERCGGVYQNDFGKKASQHSWAEEAVRKSLSITETEALKKNVIQIYRQEPVGICWILSIGRINHYKR